MPNSNEVLIPARIAQGVCSDEADEDLRRRLMNVLYASRIPGADSLEVESNGGLVVVRGRLPSPRAKWLCVECCRQIAGVITFVEQLEVRNGTTDV